MPAPVRLHQRIRNLHRVLQHLPKRYALPRNHLLQRLAAHVLHRDKIHAVFRSDVVDGNYVGMVQRRGGLRLLHEAPLALRVRDLFGGQHLQRHQPVEPQIAGLPDDAHAAFAQLLLNLVMSENAPDHVV
jgi:hypothetical protein